MHRPIDQFLAAMMQVGASDLHLSAGTRPSVRVDGELIPLQKKYPNLLPEQLVQIAKDLPFRGEWEDIVKGVGVNFTYEMATPPGRFRIMIYQQQRGIAIAARYISHAAPNLQDLGLPAFVPAMTTPLTGLIIICGATGSGKSTTMAAIVNEINRRYTKHIITIEDPIEYEFRSESCVVHQREVGTHVTSIEAGVTEALRQDPDVLVLGEVRTLEEVRRALLAAETGHLVLTTVHSSTADRAVERLISVFPEGEQEMARTIVAENIRLIVAQQLLPRATGRGRLPALEILSRTEAVSSLIREQKTHQIQTVIQTGAAQGMCTMNDSLASLVARGEIKEQIALDHSPNARTLETILAGKPRR